MPGVSVIKMAAGFDRLALPLPYQGRDKCFRRHKKQMPVRGLAFGGMNESDSLLGGLDPEGIEQQAAGDCHGHEATEKDKGHGPVSQYVPDGLFDQTHSVFFIQ